MENIEDWLDRFGNEGLPFQWSALVAARRTRARVKKEHQRSLIEPPKGEKENLEGQRYNDTFNDNTEMQARGGSETPAPPAAFSQCPFPILTCRGLADGSCLGVALFSDVSRGNIQQKDVERRSEGSTGGLSGLFLRRDFPVWGGWSLLRFSSPTSHLVSAKKFIRSSTPAHTTIVGVSMSRTLELLRIFSAGWVGTINNYRLLSPHALQLQVGKVMEKASLSN